MRRQTVHVSTGKFHTAIDTTPHLPGQLGMIVYDKQTDAHYQYVKLSSTAADRLTPTVAKKIVALWKDSAAFEVCTLLTSSQGSVNAVAGIFLGAPLAGQYCWIQKSGKAVVTSDSASVGQVLTYKTGSPSGGGCTVTNVGTAPINMPVGSVVQASGTFTWCGVDETASGTNVVAQLALMGE